jgi:Helitron helicase-like domain at N-terminus
MPLLVRKNAVGKALEWLKLNHVDYSDLDIAYNNLEAYPDDGPPVVVTYRTAMTNKNPEAVSAFDNDKEEGVDSGPCPFTVNGITGEKLNTMGPKALIAQAIKNLTEDDGKVLAVGHAAKPESMYNNPQLYPMMFPWLFPYGLGGIGCVEEDDVEMSDMMHKRKRLMYHDKHFQMDAHFPLIAFNHEQVKKSTTGGFLLTNRQDFDDIAERLMNVIVGVLEDLSKRLSRGDRIKPVTEEEKACYSLISDIDHVGGHVPGSITSKKYLRNEIWSLISYIGAPSWFIMFAPADNKHPICLDYADTKETFSPDIRPDNECYRLIAHNPVASARFFHFMVQMFIKHVLGVGQDHPGLYGNTSAYYAYYGTIEQQGRLTLHLHLLLWICGSLTPQELCNKIMDVNSDFQKKLVEYLESLCVGEFLTGLKTEISERVSEESKSAEYRNPTLTLPNPPVDLCGSGCIECPCDQERRSWWRRFRDTVDNLLLRSNQHVHSVDKDGNNISYCATAKGECKC